MTLTLGALFVALVTIVGHKTGLVFISTDCREKIFWIVDVFGRTERCDKCSKLPVTVDLYFEVALMSKMATLPISFGLNEEILTIDVPVRVLDDGYYHGQVKCSDFLSKTPEEP